MRKNAHARISWWIVRGESIPPAPRFVAFCAPWRRFLAVTCRTSAGEPRIRRRHGRLTAMHHVGVSMREIVVDTETTGLDPYQGHRVVEVGCVELFNRIPTGTTFHRYINPHRDVPAEAF